MAKESFTNKESHQEDKAFCQCNQAQTKVFPWYLIFMPFELGQVFGLGANEFKDICPKCNNIISKKRRT